MLTLSSYAKVEGSVGCSLSNFKVFDDALTGPKRPPPGVVMPFCRCVLHFDFSVKSYEKL